ncbi:hypothetical protein E1265_27170 [Streptomyces sp. 8K308]|uniref:hypothetical protein n=1 Tax=Streptomyces sp. 8K308 TaxID=2530388 RepID=UPI00104E14E6|nr:hypothetical protein [Streptomyces sp. 8K308]TDC15163.1 hypothetical protein E1265_27170 [Streptomyces sp. 8K308]
MSGYPADLDALRGIVDWLETELTGARAALAAAEQRVAEDEARPRFWVGWDRRPHDRPRTS